MATLYAGGAGNWSTLTWFNAATGGMYSPGVPQPGDVVHANGFAVAIDLDITLLSLSTRGDAFAASGGSFSTVGRVNINAATYAGTTNCLTLTSGSGSVQNGNSFGSNSTNSRYGTTIGSGCIQNGSSHGGNGDTRSGSIVNVGGLQNGNSFGGTGGSAFGTVLSTGGRQNGIATGGSASSAHGTTITGSGALFYGRVFGGAVNGAHGLNIGSSGSVAIIESATGTVPGGFGVRSVISIPHIVLIKSESGSFAKSITAVADSNVANVPFVNYGGLSIGRIISGGV